MTISPPPQILSPVIRFQRIGLCGGTRIREDNARFCEELGAQLAAEESLILVSGGFKCFTSDSTRMSGDWAFVKGARDWLKAGCKSLDTRIETLLPDPKQDRPNTERFKIGTVIHLQGRSLQSRRFRLVGATDTLVAIEGAKGTREIIDLALALEKPILPLPFTGGVAATRWNENKALICEWFDIDKKTARAWETTQLTNLSQVEIVDLARTVKRHLLHQLRRKCFVMMPFSSEFLPLYHEAIRPAIDEIGFVPVRTDQLNFVGDTLSVLHGAIRTCSCGLAVITGNNPNVLYELGLTHAQGKQSILLCKFSSGRCLPELPYDLRNEFVIGYKPDDWNSLRQTISAVLKQIKGE